MRNLTLNNHTCRCIDKTITGSNKCIGYCKYEMHPGFLTEKLAKEHDCHNKNCHYFVTKEQKQIKTKVISANPLVLDFLKTNIPLEEGIKFLKVLPKNSNTYVAYYVSLTHDFSFDLYVFLIKMRYKINIIFKQLDYDFDVCTSLFLRDK